MTLPTTWPVRTDDAGDGHRPEAGDDALGHVHRDRDRRALGRAGDRDQQDARQDVGECTRRGRRRTPAEARAERAAEDVDEQQQEHDRDAGDEEGQRRVAAHPAEVAPEHRRRVGHGDADRWSSDGRLLVGRLWSPVSDRKTSSRSGVWTASPPTSMEAASSRSRSARSERVPPSLGSWRVSASSSARSLVEDLRRPAPSSAASANASRMWPPGTRRLSSFGVPCGDEPALVEDGDPMGEPIRLLEVLRRQEDRDAARRRARGRCPT